MRAIVLTNPAAGAKADAIHELEAAMREAGVTPEVRQAPGEQMANVARAAMKENVDTIVAAGGDGTIGAVAGALAGSNMPLGILPTGTLNHFAKDLGLPLDLREVSRVIAAKNIRRVDVADLNGRIFINNASIGIYPHMVGHRDSQRQRLGRGKWVSMIIAAVAIFRRYPTVRVRIMSDDRSVVHTTPFVFVGNNRYEMSFTTLGQRARLDAGELTLWFANVRGRFGLFRLALRAVAGRLEQSKDFESMTTQEVWIDSSKRALRVAIDGEVTSIAPPLHFRVRPGALSVLGPPPAESSKASEGPAR